MGQFGHRPDRSYPVGLGAAGASWTELIWSHLDLTLAAATLVIASRAALGAQLHGPSRDHKALPSERSTPRLFQREEAKR